MRVVWEGVGLGWALCYLIQRAIEECNNARIYQGKQAKGGGDGIRILKMKGSICGWDRWGGYSLIKYMLYKNLIKKYNDMHFCFG